jgi:hypothetical protein
MPITRLSTVAKREALVLAIILGLFVISLLPALLGVRMERRDGERRTHLAGLKRALEDFNNAQGFYPAPPAAARESCAMSNNEEDWLFGGHGLLRTVKGVGVTPKVPVSKKGWQYLYCVTDVDGTSALSWFLRTRLERKPEPDAGLDLERDHNFYYRITSEGGAAFYDICGGLSRCGVEISPER